MQSVNELFCFQELKEKKEVEVEVKEDKKEKREENGSGDAPANGTVSGRQGCQICSQGCQIGRRIWPQSGNSGGGTASLEARVARLETWPNLATLVGVQ